jgi:putative membrane protein
MNIFTQSVKQYIWPLIFTLAYLVPFSIHFISSGDGEFIWYIFIVIGLFALVMATLPISQFTRGVVWVLSVWALLHLAGGSLKIGEGVLYDLQLIPLYRGAGEMILIKYDQLVHAFGFGICAYIIFHFLKRYTYNPYRIGVYLIAGLGAMGLGVVNEIAEFIAVLLFPDNGVGGYVNTALDLVFNTLGAGIVIVIVWLRNRKKTGLEFTRDLEEK